MLRRGKMLRRWIGELDANRICGNAMRLVIQLSTSSINWSLFTSSPAPMVLTNQSLSMMSMLEWEGGGKGHGDPAKLFHYDQLPSNGSITLNFCSVITQHSISKSIDSTEGIKPPLGQHIRLIRLNPSQSTQLWRVAHDESDQTIDSVANQFEPMNRTGSGSVKPSFIHNPRLKEFNAALEYNRWLGSTDENCGNTCQEWTDCNNRRFPGLFAGQMRLLPTKRRRIRRRGKGRGRKIESNNNNNNSTKKEQFDWIWSEFGRVSLGGEFRIVTRGVEEGPQLLHQSVQQSSSAPPHWLQSQLSTI